MRILERPRPRTRPPERPADAPDWELPWIVVFPALLVLLQLVPAALGAFGVPFGIGSLLGFTILADLAAAALAWYCLCVRPGRPPSRLGLKPPRRKRDLVVLPLLGLLLGMVAVYIGEQVTTMLRGGSVPPPQRTVQVLGSLQDPGLRALALIAVAVVAPVAEELLFRGIAFRSLQRRLGGTAALLLSSALFTLAHVDLGHAAHLFGLGIVLAWLVRRSGSLYPSMILHAVVNGGALLLAW